MQRFRGLLDAVIGRLRIVIRAVDLPVVARPGRMRHPQQPAAVACPQMCSEALEDRAIIDIVHHLRLALEVLEARRTAELRGERLHERRNVAVAAKMPIVIGNRVAERPAVGGRHHGAYRLERRERRRPEFDREPQTEIGEIAGRSTVVVRAAILQVHAIRTAGIKTRPIKCAHQFRQSFVDDRLRNALVSSEPDRDRRMVSIARDGVARILQK